MARREHVEVVKQGWKAIRAWREGNPHVRLHLSRADLSGAHLSGADLRKADLIGANLYGAYLSRADLREAHMSRADLRRAYLSGAHLSGANLNGVDLSRADLREADFTNAMCAYTTFTDVDLSSVKGLETVEHHGPSYISVDTLYRSGGKIPEVFLRGCGLPEEFVNYLPSLIGAEQAIQFYSCFISYSHKDEDFARRLHSRMRQANLRVWYAPEDMKGGQKIHEQLEQAIQLHDRLLLVLSENSLGSKWVESEIREALRIEKKEKRRKLFPIRLVNMEGLREWKCFNADLGQDMAAEVREYHIPDFSNWKDHDAFEAAFARLLADLRAAEAKGAGV